MWLFDTDSLPTADSSEELICSILALGLAYSADDFVDTDLQEPAFYSYNGRKLIMLKIADGSFSIQTIQSLCLLAFFNVTCKSARHSRTVNGGLLISEQLAT